ncbi:MAG TPA: hypothetical protein VFR25_05915, partial [Candidatus Eisenbacteria bacterium]|nr:hypothetical protein [Candidatus Eisenbacteria bacterium]
GVALAGLGRPREAVEGYDEALRIRPELVYRQRARADARDALGDTLLAKEDRERAAAKERDSYAPALDPFRY